MILQDTGEGVLASCGSYFKGAFVATRYTYCTFAEALLNHMYFFYFY